MRSYLLCLVGAAALAPAPSAALAEEAFGLRKHIALKKHGARRKKHGASSVSKNQMTANTKPEMTANADGLPDWIVHLVERRRKFKAVQAKEVSVGGLEEIDTHNPNSSAMLPATQLVEVNRGRRKMLVPYTVWSFGDMPYSAREAFCKASRNWGASQAYVWHMPAVELLLEKHPEWKDVWSKMPRTVMKSDVARYLVAYEHGGTYTDYDVLGRRPPPAEDGTSLVLQVEQTLERWQVSPRSVTGREKHYLQRIAQYFFAVEPKHRFFEMVLAESLARVSGLLEENHTDWADKWVLWSTGPDVITTIYHDYFEKDPSVLLTDQDTIAKHLSAGAWKRGKDTVAS